jgi:LPS O-antigen subunit length determinant protein (WzzB/FepE family)
MASLKVFVSSTCYDLGMIRSHLRNFISSFGYDPIMSDYSDVLYDPRHHTHTSCIQEVSNCDILVLIIGKRFGGSAIPKALDEVDVEKVRTLSRSSKIFEPDNKLSITQLEVIKALELGIPIFTFVDSKVYHDHFVYEKNKDAAILKSITFPSIEKKDTAVYIFEFINFINHLTDNNSLQEFSRTEDIETHLRKQWSGLLQRLLAEQKSLVSEERKLEYISKQIADIKTTILTTTPNNDLKETAKASIKFRHFIELMLQFQTDSIETKLTVKTSWDKLLKKLDIKESRMLPTAKERMGRSEGLAFIKNDDTFYLSERFTERTVEAMQRDWTEFSNLDKDKKSAVLEAIKDDFDPRRPFSRFRYYDITVDVYLLDFENENE